MPGAALYPCLSINAQDGVLDHTTNGFVDAPLSRKVSKNNKFNDTAAKLTATHKHCPLARERLPLPEPVTKDKIIN
jgi:hypothetical protein